MAYENVDTQQLRSSLNACKSSLNCVTSASLTRMSDSIWTGQAKNNLTSAIGKLVKTRYKDLSDKIDEYLKVVDQIENYQKLSSSSGSLSSQKASKEAELRKEQAKPNKDVDKIRRLQTEIGSLNSQINSVNSQKNSISINI